MTTQVAVGSELDALVAEKVMGWERYDRHGWWLTNPAEHLDRALAVLPDYAFSTSWEGVGLVIERMRELGWEMALDDLRYSYRAVFRRRQDEELRYSQSRQRPTAPEAVCRAALAALAML